MNILNVTSITELRGGDVQMYTIYELLKEYQDVNQYILCDQNSELNQLFGKLDANFITYPKSNKILSLINPIRKAVKEKKIDIVHIHDSSALTATLLASLSFPENVKIILSRKRDKKIKKNFLGKIKYGNSKISKILCVSKAVASIFDHVVKDQSKVITIYDGIDVSKFEGRTSKNLIHQELGLSSDTKLIGNVAALENQKDLLTFIDAASLIKKSKVAGKVKFVIIGDGSQKENIISYIKSKELENEIFLLGFRKNIADLLPEFDILLMTSISEGLPLTVYEAFACKVPVVSTKAGGIPEVVIDGFSGMLTEIKDSKMLSKCALRLLDNESLKMKITENAFKMVKERFDLPVLKENYYQFYKSI